MNDPTNTIPEPDEQFIDAFEQQLRHGIRRRALLDSADLVPTRTRRKGMKMLGSASLIVLSMMLGATGTYAVVHPDPPPHRELMVQKAEILLERALMRIDLRREDLADAQALADRNFVDTSVLEASRQKLVDAEAEFLRRQLNLSETRMTGRAANDELDAPVIGGEDFVLKRLESHVVGIDLMLQRAKTELQHAQQLVDRGFMSDRESSRARADVRQAEQVMERLHQRIKLRRSFAAGEITAAEIVLSIMLDDSNAELIAAQARLTAAKQQLDRVTALQESGAVSEGDARKAQFQFRDAESELRLAELQLTMIRERVAAPDSND